MLRAVRNVAALIICCLSMLVFLSAASSRDESEAGASGTVPPTDAGHARPPAVGDQRPAEPDSRAGSAPALPAGSEPAWSIVMERGKHLKPIEVAATGNDLYFLGKTAVWKVAGVANLLNNPTALVGSRQVPKAGRVNGVPVQEFSNFVVSPERNSLVVLDKTGDIFEMSIADGSWKA